MIKKVDIKKHIEDQPKIKTSSKQDSLMDSPMFMMAKQMLPSIPGSWKAGILLAVYFIGAGIVATGIWIYKLISYIF